MDNRQPLEDALRELYVRLREERHKAFDRVLPFAELLVDRWEKARHLDFGPGASIYDSAIVFGDVEVGERTWIGPYTVLDGSGGLKIGRSCSISTGVQIYSHDSVRWALSGGRQPYEYGRVEIGDHCYIGPNTIVTRGVQIGSRCLVGANSIVNRSLPDGVIAFGSTCRIVGKVDVDDDGRVTLRYNSGQSPAA